MAIAYFVGALPHEPKSLVLITSRGEIVGQYRFKQSHHHLFELVSGIEEYSSRAVHTSGCGNFCCNVNIGTDGAQVTIPLNSDYLIYVDLPQVKSYDVLVKAIHEGLAPLKDTLGLK